MRKDMRMMKFMLAAAAVVAFSACTKDNVPLVPEDEGNVIRFVSVHPSQTKVTDTNFEVNDTIESRERRELPVKIYFKPYNALEYITIDFILTPEGVSFDDI